MPVALALLASMLWGTSDFLGGTASRRHPSTTVLVSAGLVALPVMVVVAVVGGHLVFDVRTIGWGIVAGVSCSIGILLLYRGLATGIMGVVAPIASTAVLVPVLVALVRGDRPGAWKMLGVAIAIGGVILAGGPNVRDFRNGGHVPILLSLGAALGLGVSLLAVANGAETSTYATLLTMRATYPVLPVALLLASGAPRFVPSSSVLLVVGVGLSDVAALTLYGSATESGSLAVVAALASMFPVMTLVLARRIHRERLRLEQWIGVAIALVGVVLVVAAGA